MQYLGPITKQIDLSSLPRQTIQYTVIQVYASITDAKEAEVDQFYEDWQGVLELTPKKKKKKKDFLFIIGDWNEKVGSQEIPGVTGKFGLGVQNKAGQRLTEFCQENTLIIANTFFNNTRDDFTHCCCCSVTQSCLTERPHGLQHTRLPCPSLFPGVSSNSCPLSWWCHPTISSSIPPCPRILNLSQHQGFFQWVSS